MIKPDYKIIAVDNDQAELELLMTTLHFARIPCIPIKYNSGEDIVEKYSGIRIAFFDINLAEGNNSGSQLHSIISHALSQILYKDNGPYALIFWTKHQTEIEEIKSYIQDPERGFQIPTPLIIDCIDKTKILTKEELMLELERVLSNSTLEALLDFEEKVQKSASQIIDSFFTTIPKGSDKWGESATFDKKFNQLFSRIAISALGYNHAKENPDRAIYEALMPLVSNALINADDTKWKSVLTILSESDINSQPTYPIGFEPSKLNSIFHIDKIKDHKKNKRGIVLEYKHIPVKSTNRFDYIRDMCKECKMLFSKFIEFDTVNSTPLVRDLIRIKSKFIAIEISSACDYSQEKSRNNKFVLGLLIPKKDENIFKLNNISEAVFYKELPIIYYDNEDYSIYVNLNYTLSDFEISEKICDPLFILKKEIMDLIGNRYANHVSRIGITSF